MQQEEVQILDTWFQNSTPWINAIATDAIESRKLVTNGAIVEAITALNPTKVWDIGCGEGWLCRRLNATGIPCIGTDAIPDLIAAATKGGGGTFQVLAYQEITAEIVSAFMADTFVFNFSLFGEEGVKQTVSTLYQAMPIGSHLVIQSLHPFAAKGDYTYASGWRTGSWAGFSQDFVNPAPWYYRTISNWINLLIDCGFKLVNLKEPRLPDAAFPASLILIASKG